MIGLLTALALNDLFLIPFPSLLSFPWFAFISLWSKNWLKITFVLISVDFHCFENLLLKNKLSQHWTLQIDLRVDILTVILLAYLQKYSSLRYFETSVWSFINIIDIQTELTLVYRCQCWCLSELVCCFISCLCRIVILSFMQWLKFDLIDIHNLLSLRSSVLQ